MRWSLAVSLFPLLLGCAGPDPGARTEPPPPTRTDDVVDVIHGVEIVDPYRWLEDQESPETRTWIDAQNAYTQAHLGDLPERAALRRRLEELVTVDRVRTPLVRGDRYFLWKKRADDELWILYLREGLEGEDQVLIDPHSLSTDHTTSVTLVGASPDGELLAYGVRVGGVDEVELRLMDVENRRDLPERFPTARYSQVVFTPDKAEVYYSRQDPKTGFRVYRHELGTEPADDPAVFGEEYGPGQWISPELSDSGRYLLFWVAHGWSRTEVFVTDLVAGGGPKSLTKGLEASFSPAFAGDRLFVQTDWQAPMGRIFEIDLAQKPQPAWKPVVPEGDAAMQGFSLAGGVLFVHTLENVVSRIERFTPEGESLGEMVMPGAGTAGTPQGSWESPSAFFSFESYVSPPSFYRFDTGTGETELWSRDDVPFHPEGVQAEQAWYRSKDGTDVPMFILRRADVELDGSRPTLLYGYGGFNVSLTPRFRPLAAVWIESGGVFAVANLRGGGEFGEAWHRAGMLENKQNVFDDFIAAAEWLVEKGYTRPEKLAIQGGSNGGLLVGAAMTQRPELFRAVLCEFPDLDMVRYYQFENNNPPALLEYGDARDPEQFRFLLAYSPYQAVRDGAAYPAVLLTSGDSDTRVPPLQARKMAARLQAATSSGRPVFLHYGVKAGHAGGRPQSKLIDDLSLEAAFLTSQLGLELDREPGL